jgi:hypothetical protein
MQTLNIGVVGYCPPSVFDVDEARRMIVEVFDLLADKYPKRDITVVAGLINVGVLAIAYQEAVKREWETLGIASAKVRGMEWFPVDDYIIIGEDRGDESNRFIASCDILVKIGGGKQSGREADLFRSMDGEVYEYDLPLLDN